VLCANSMRHLCVCERERLCVDIRIHMSIFVCVTWCVTRHKVCVCDVSDSMCYLSIYVSVIVYTYTCRYMCIYEHICVCDMALIALFVMSDSM